MHVVAKEELLLEREEHRTLRHSSKEDEWAFSVWTEFTVPTGKRSGHPRGMALVTRMAALQAEQRRETQWHPRMQTSIEKRAPYAATSIVIPLSSRREGIP
jgi:hypothetical protein